MQALRHSPPQKIAGIEVEKRVDYLEKPSGLPSSDVLEFNLKDQSRVTIRPSGTEPKLKVYAEARGQTMEKCQQKLQTLLNSTLDF